jgi:hypothetical protein
MDYEGPVKCNACSAILSVKLEDGKLRFMDFVRFSKPGDEDALRYR